MKIANRDTPMGFKPIWLAITIALLVGVATLPAQAQGHGVLPPPTSPNGNTYGEWTALWWRWFLHLPNGQNPVTGGDCGNGQVGSVWFLAGIPTENGTNTVNCSVPKRTYLLVPIINVECSNLEEEPFFGETPEERRACAKALMDGASNLAAWVDGHFVSNIEKFRFTSPNFTFAVPPDNVFGLDPGFGESVGDGYYIMLAPLSPGTHTIRVKGSLPDFDFTIDTTFVINVSN
jgi:hypothetical protein